MRDVRTLNAIHFLSRKVQAELILPEGSRPCAVSTCSGSIRSLLREPLRFHYGASAPSGTRERQRASGRYASDHWASLREPLRFH